MQIISLSGVVVKELQTITIYSNRCIGSERWNLLCTRTGKKWKQLYSKVDCSVISEVREVIN